MSRMRKRWKFDGLTIRHKCHPSNGKFFTLDSITSFDGNWCTCFNKKGNNKSGRVPAFVKKWVKQLDFIEKIREI